MADFSLCRAYFVTALLLVVVFVPRGQASDVLLSAVDRKHNVEQGKTTSERHAAIRPWKFSSDDVAGLTHLNLQSTKSGKSEIAQMLPKWKGIESLRARFDKLAPFDVERSKKMHRKFLPTAATARQACQQADWDNFVANMEGFEQWLGGCLDDDECCTADCCVGSLEATTVEGILFDRITAMHCEGASCFSVLYATSTTDDLGAVSVVPAAKDSCGLAGNNDCSALQSASCYDGQAVLTTFAGGSIAEFARTLRANLCGDTGSTPRPSPVPSTPVPTPGSSPVPSTPIPTPGQTAPPAPLPTASPDSRGPEDNGVCFPSTSSVALGNGSLKRMDQLNVGDVVRSGVWGETSAVHFFSHRESNSINTFLQISHSLGNITLTPSHFLYANGGLVKAKNVKIGDSLQWTSGGQRSDPVVTSIEMVRRRGLYNPHTMQGTLIVDGIRTSCYTSTVHPGLAHIVLAPLRAFYRLGIRAGNFLDKGAKQWVLRLLDSTQNKLVSF
mmetsp:Transcript_9985/g.23897  ORF Transcript_9985/g.23897 Transcript_9985/m.23897 type:complete len:500 (+) Transcript_9985:212-1711(+)